MEHIQIEPGKYYWCLENERYILFVGLRNGEYNCIGSNNLFDIKARTVRGKYQFDDIQEVSPPNLNNPSVIKNINDKISTHTKAIKQLEKMLRRVRKM